jgi:hypothetical protein
MNMTPIAITKPIMFDNIDALFTKEFVQRPQAEKWLICRQARRLILEPLAEPWGSVSPLKWGPGNLFPGGFGQRPRF